MILANLPERAITGLRAKLPRVRKKPASKTDTGSNRTANKPAGKTRKPTRGTAIRLAGIPRVANR